jgi:hypothetical protein
MGEVVQLQGDQRKDVQDFLTDKKEGLGLDAKTIKVSHMRSRASRIRLLICLRRSTVSNLTPSPSSFRVLVSKQLLALCCFTEEYEHCSTTVPMGSRGKRLEEKDMRGSQYDERCMVDGRVPSLINSNG